MVKKIVGIVVLVAFVAMTSAAFAADVYVTKNGKKYHTENCPLIKSKQTTKMDEAQATQSGLVPCSKCHKGDMVKADSKVKK